MLLTRRRRDGAPSVRSDARRLALAAAFFLFAVAVVGVLSAVGLYH